MTESDERDVPEVGEYPMGSPENMAYKEGYERRVRSEGIFAGGFFAAIILVIMGCLITCVVKLLTL